jgi:anti-anti-sigma regulatory factor
MYLPLRGAYGFGENITMSITIAQTAVRRIDKRAAIVDIHADVTGENEAALLDAFVEASRCDCPVVILNLSEAKHVTSRCAELIIIILTSARRQKQRLLAYGASHHYERMLAATGLVEEVAVYHSEAEAVAAASSIID